MTDDTHDAYAADDAILLYLVRDGDTKAYQVLRGRHEQAALRLARCVVPAQEAEDLAARAFARVLDITLRGGGPIDAFRPYLLTAVRQASNGGLHADGDAADTGQLPDPGEPLIDPSALGGLEMSPIVRAFRSLPERWIAVLWHTEIERADPAEAGPILGLAPGEVATLQRRAWDGLRQAYLEVHIADGARPECQPVVRLLAAYVDGRASSRDSAMVAEHLSRCDDCRAVRAELSDIDAALAIVVAPVFLGSAATAYLSAERTAIATEKAEEPGTAEVGDGLTESAEAAAGPTGTAAITPTAPAAAPADPQPAGPQPEDPQAADPQPAARQWRRPARPLLWAIAAAIPVIGVVIALTLTFTRGGAPQAQNQPQAQTAAAPTSAGAAAGSPAGRQPKNARTSTDPVAASPGSSPASVSAHSASPDPGTRPSPSVAPTPGRSSPAAAQLSATVNVDVWQTNTSEVVWAVTDTGNAPTGTLTVSFSLPTGSSLQSGGADQAESDGWTCQPTNAGASCQTSAVAPGSQAQGAMVISIDGPEACNYPVGITASSGKASASAISAQGVACNPRE